MQAIDECPDAYVHEIKTKQVPEFHEITETKSAIYANINTLDDVHQLRISNYDDLAVTAHCDDPIFTLSTIGEKSHNGVVPLRVSLRQGTTLADAHQWIKSHSGDSYCFNAIVTSSDERCIIVNPQIKVYVDNTISSSLDILSGQYEEHEVKPDAHYYDSFLWSKASEFGKVSIDLQPRFSANVIQSSCGRFKLMESNDNGELITPVGINDIRLNGVSLPSHIIEINPCNPAILEIEFAPDSKEGNRYFMLVEDNSEDISVINGKPIKMIDDGEGIGLRTSYSKNWNPLKTYLFWISMIVLAGFLLWFIFLKRIFHPTIKVSRITITGPDSYYTSKKIKGFKNIQLTDKGSQNVLNRILTGKTLFIYAEHFKPSIIIEPCHKKKVRICLNPKAWSIFPSAILPPREQAELTNNQTQEKATIEIE